MDLSLVIPLLNERESLPLLVDHIRQVATGMGVTWEVVLVDDGSTDGSWDVIRQLGTADGRVKGIRFGHNYGKSAALNEGFRAVQGEVVITMDADLQDDPAEIPRFLSRLDEGYDVVNGWKQRRLDPWHKVYPSKVFNWLVSKLTGLKLHDHNCGLKAFRREVGRELRLYGELHRFTPVLAYARGFRVTEVPVNHRPREHGHSKYGVRRFLRGFLDLLTVRFITGFADRPQHMLGGLGMLFFGLGLLGLGYLAVVWLLMNVFGVLPVEPVGGRPLLIYSMASLLLGFQAFSLGLLAELLIHKTGHESDPYSIAERTTETHAEEAVGR